jgi:hypothetical protein
MKSLKLVSLASFTSIVLFALVGCGAQPGSNGGDDESAASLTKKTGSGTAAPAQGTTTTSADGLEVHSRVVRESTTPVVLTLDSKTVFCTDRGYGMTVLKVSVPDLDWLAHFDHRVEGEGLPCMTAGACTPSFGPNAVTEGAEARVTSSVHVTLTEVVTLDRTKKTCERRLDEEVDADIRGHAFTHSRSGNVEPSDFETCAAIAKL